jgi:glucose uptake protein GlcU
MKKFNYFLILIGSYLYSYLFLSFIDFDLNIYNWSETQRFAINIIALVTFFIVSLYFDYYYSYFKDFKNLKNNLIDFLCLLVIFYVIFSILLRNYNISTWHPSCRLLYVIITTFVFVTLNLLYSSKKESK